MSNKKFDDILKDKLSKLDLSYDESSWEMFEEKLDHALEQDDDAAFDEQIKAKIEEKQNIPYNEEHWYELNDKIDYENALTNKIYTYKLVELFILFLIVYSFFQIKPSEKPHHKKALTAYNEVFKQTINDEVIAKVEEEQIRRINEVSVVNSVIESKPSNITTAFSSRNLITTNLLDNKYSLVNNVKSIAANGTLSNQLKQSSIFNQMLIVETPSSRTSTAEEEIIDIASIERLGIGEHEHNPEALAMTIVNHPNQMQKWMSISANADMNIINTPIEYLFNDKDRLLGVLGTSAQLGYGLKTGRNEFEFGIGYSYKSYDPSLREVFGVDNVGVYESNLDKIEFHVAQLSASYKRYFVDNRNWSIYGAMGAIHNFILFSKYDISSDLRSGISSPRSRVKESSELLARNYYTGLLQNTTNNKTEKRIAQSDFRTEGDLFDNTFITPYLGLGIQKNFGPNRSLFLQQSYQHQLFANKLGPNNDQINSFSLTVGAKFKI